MRQLTHASALDPSIDRTLVAGFLLPHGRTGRIRRNLIFSTFAFACALLLTQFPYALDFPVTTWLNAWANRFPLVDWAFYVVDNYYTFSGILIMSLIVACWFNPPMASQRPGILIGTTFAGLSASLSRFLQHALPTHPRPMYDRALGFHEPLIFASRKANHWNSFPSDHATVFFGLVAVLFLVHSRFRWPALLWLAGVETARTYAGAHYPSDLLGGAALGWLLVWAAQLSWPLALGRRIAALSETYPAAFHGCLLFAAYQIASLANDLRSAASALYAVR